jgi:D-alanyl-D-alanine dipeptidase
MKSMSGSNRRGGLPPVVVLASIGLMGIAVAAASASAADARLAPGFVHLSAVAPEIRQDIRYFSADNFTGRKVPGYEAGECILARPVAEALGRVQARLERDGFGLLVFDCYRPVSAVRGFMAWAAGQSGDGNRDYFPRISRARVIPLGYVARRSSHSRGISVDLTLVRLPGGATVSGKEGVPAGGQARDTAATCLEAARFNRSADEVDMGTAFDCFDVKSHTASTAVGGAQRANRRRLVDAMAREGFQNYAREWWHFSMPLEGYGKARDFPVR